MKVSTKGRYALRIMIDLAQSGEGEVVSLKDIACLLYTSPTPTNTGISAAISSDWVMTGCGVKGLSLIHISGESTCRRADRCEALPMWKQLDRIIDAYLESVTLQNLIDQARDSGSCCV